MAQISVNLSEAETGIKGGIGVGTGRYNQESAIQVVIDMVQRRGGSISEAAIAAIIEQQNPGAPANVKESHDEFEEALSLGIDPRTFNSVSNTKELLKQAKAGTRLTSSVIQEIDAPTRNVQRTASLRDYNLLTNQDPNQKVYDLYKGQATRLFGIAKDATIGDLTDAKLDQLTAAQGQIGSDLFWAVRKEQDRRGADTGTDMPSSGASAVLTEPGVTTMRSGGSFDISADGKEEWDRFLQRIEARGDDLSFEQLISDIQTYLSDAGMDFQSSDNFQAVVTQLLDNYSIDTESTFGIHLRGLLEAQMDPGIFSGFSNLVPDPTQVTEPTSPLMNLPGEDDPARAGAVWEMFNPLQQETFGQAYERFGAIQGGGPLAERYRAMMAPIAQLQYKLQPEAMGLMNLGASPREFLRSGQMLGGEDLTTRLNRLSDVLRRSAEQPTEYMESYGIAPGTLEDPSLDLEALTSTPEGMRYMQDMFLREGFKDPQMQALAGILPAMMQSAPQTWGILSRGAKNLANIALGTNPSANILKMLGYGR